ncbi:ClpX C4-type zinc finger protein [Mycobacterium sp. 236(2023)]|uniref:ClpX C4-type zinc finger protein n=1 Tax=Mycobacterium sp. 236(2023) TaxID=3038163 RepID=UPI002414EA2D|nr:ClpX C4-type zinc finger protein [Mycobacterium sp. 236(2023)]MDG4664409.1 ClpX C4-type zinc finger protein [Mycobacterium sp. 236(2023)]
MGATMAETRYCAFCGEARPRAQVVAGLGVYICEVCIAECVSILEGRLGVEGFRRRHREACCDEELLSQIPRVAATKASVEEDLRARVRELRQRKVTWSRIAAELGVTRQSAWERFTVD